MKFLFFLFSFFLLYYSHAQDTLSNAQIDSFYNRYQINIQCSQNPELYQEIYRWLDVCYRYGGNLQSGIDCSHFVNMLYQKIYGKELNSNSSAMYEQCKPLKGGTKKAVEGDLLFFKIKKKKISHVGIYLQDGYFAHASTKLGVTINNISEPYYQKYFFKAGKVK